MVQTVIDFLKKGWSMSISVIRECYTVLHVLEGNQLSEAKLMLKTNDWFSYHIENGTSYMWALILLLKELSKKYYLIVLTTSS